MNNMDQITTCKQCDGWVDKVVPHRHEPNEWIMPSASTPGVTYLTRVIRQLIDDGLPGDHIEGKPNAYNCNCPAGQQPDAEMCWHAAAAMSFEHEHYEASHKRDPKYGDPFTNYHAACDGSLKAQAVILWSWAREAARQQDKRKNTLRIRALERIVEAWNVQLPEGIEMRITCLECLGMQFPEMHAHYVDPPRLEENAAPKGPEPEPDDGTELDNFTEEEIEAAWQELMSPMQRELHMTIQSYERRGQGNHAHNGAGEEW